MKKFILSDEIVQVPITVNFDYDQVVGWAQIDRKYADLLCTNPSIEIGRSFVSRGKGETLKSLSICKKSLISLTKKPNV